MWIRRQRACTAQVAGSGASGAPGRVQKGYRVLRAGPFILEGSLGPWLPHHHHVVRAEAREI